MDTMTIIYIVVAFVVGAILTSIFKKGSNSASSDNAKLQELEAEKAYNRAMTGDVGVYHRDHEDRHREKGRKRYMGANGGADR